MVAVPTSLADLTPALARRTASELYPAFGSNPEGMINALAALVAVGQVLLVVLLVTFLVSHRIGRRNPTLLNVILVSILSGFPGLLLVYSGNVFVQHVSPVLCLTQATLKNGVDTMFVMAPLALVIELYCSTKTSTARFIAFRRVALVAMPYVTFFCFSLMTTVIGMQYPSEVFHDTNDMYCELHSTGMEAGLVVFGSVTVLVTIVMQVLTALALRRIWRTAARSKESTAVTLSIMYRLAGYTVVQVMYLIIDTLTFDDNATITIIHDVYLACMPMLVFLVYGLSGDIIRVWCCMGPRASTGSSDAPLARDISKPGPRPWTLVGSIASTDSGKALAPRDLERGTPRPSMEKPRPSADTGSDAGSQFSWDPRWERASPPHAGLPPPPLPLAELPMASARDSRTPVVGKGWGQSF